MKAASLTLLAALPLIALAGPALAHAHLQASTPAADATVTASPSTLALTFSEGLNLAFSAADLADAKGASVTTGKPSLSGTDGTVMTIPLDTPLSAGTYNVHWHVLSNDGHKTQGDYSFTIQP